MAIAQQFKSACELATNMPPLVAQFIEIDKDLKRRFREDSMTDVLLASFLMLPPSQVLIDTPTEWKTGADFDLFIGQRGNDDLTHYRIQAKRLCDHKRWEQGRYHSLAHRVKSTQQLQCDTLCSSAPPDCIPLYAFYNHRDVVAKAGGGVEGISLADAHAVRRYVHLVVAGEPEFKRIGHLAPLFFPLRTILCPADPGRPVARPEESRKAAREMIEARKAHWPPDLDARQRQLFDKALEEHRQRVRRPRRAPEGSEPDELFEPDRPSEPTPGGGLRPTATDEEPLLPMSVEKEFYEPDPAQVRADVLAAVQGERSRRRDRHIRRPRVILIGPADNDATTRGKRRVAAT